MNLTQIEKELLFESAKRMLLEADFPIGPYRGQKTGAGGSAGNSNTTNEPKGRQRRYADESEAQPSAGDQFTPSQFKKVIEGMYGAYKAVTQASFKYIEKGMDYFINGYINGMYSGRAVYLKIETELNKKYHGTGKNLNKAAGLFKKYSEQLVYVIKTTNTPENKELYYFFFKYFENLFKDYQENTDEYFRYLKYLRERIFLNEIKLTKGQVAKYHDLSHFTKTYLKGKVDKYYKTPFEASGTNKGFYESVRDMFMDEMGYEDEDVKPYNPYDNVQPDYDIERIEGHGTNEQGARNIYYAEENRLLDIYHELTKKFIDSNYKDMEAKQQANDVLERIERVREAYFKEVDDPQLKQDLDSIKKKYQGAGAWKDFKEKAVNPKIPKDPRDRYVSKDKKEPKPFYNQGSYDSDLEDYRRKNKE